MFVTLLPVVVKKTQAAPALQVVGLDAFCRVTEKEYLRGQTVLLW